MMSQPVRLILVDWFCAINQASGLLFSLHLCEAADTSSCYFIGCAATTQGLVGWLLVDLPLICFDLYQTECSVYLGPVFVKTHLKFVETDLYSCDYSSIRDCITKMLRFYQTALF